MARITIKPLHAILVLATISCASCSNDDPDDALYVGSFKKICHACAAYCRDLNTRRSPYKPGMTRKQRDIAYAQLANDAGDRFEAFSKQEDTLQASARYVSIHSESQKLYRLDADLWHEYAKTILAGDEELTPQFAKNLFND